MPSSIVMIDCFLVTLVALREINPDDEPKVQRFSEALV
jgi:hypothetical protein